MVVAAVATQLIRPPLSPRLFDPMQHGDSSYMYLSRYSHVEGIVAWNADTGHIDGRVHGLPPLFTLVVQRLFLAGVWRE